tara:strand:- start:4351 stop:5664 length:1314 start_codon:yes stop_codon:yes gene_type:complete
MSSCNNDKKKAFLNNAKARNRHRIIENQKMLDKQRSQLNGKTRYIARVLALPREESAISLITDEKGEQYDRLVKIRVEQLDSSIPDPSQPNLDENTTIVAINAHRDAFVPFQLTALKAGDIIEVDFSQAPLVNGEVKNNINPPVISRIINHDNSYFQRLIKNLGKNRSKLSKLSKSFEASNTTSTADYKPREAKHWSGVILKNGVFEEWPEATKEFLSDVNGLSDIKGGEVSFTTGEITWTPSEAGDFLQKTYFNSTKGLYSEIDGIEGPDASYEKDTTYTIMSWDESRFGSLFVPQALQQSLAKQFLNFLVEHFKNWGTKIIVTYPHRDLSEQVRLYDAHNADPVNTAAAAYPGRSNHGWAMAFDLRVGLNRLTGYYRGRKAGILSFSTADKHSIWIHNNMTGYSIAEGKKINEPWHMSYTMASRKAAFPTWKWGG